nr:RNA-directed DNA polymerase, eukaryota, reverse transcriptase zinc-binding domain protein [Tanacetum cinerariifolium]
LELEDICSSGFRFTWTKSLKNPNSSIMKKLDRIMINEEFLQQFQNAHGMFLPFVIFDHSPDVVTIPEGLKKRRSFRFVNYIADKDEFADSAKDKPTTIYMVRSWQRTVKQKITQSFEQGKEITFPPLANSNGTEGPLVIEAEIGGHTIHRMYIDGGSSMEILYEHCFNRLWPDIKKQMVPATTSLTGFKGETTWPLGQLKLLVTIGDATHSTKAWMNFMIVSSMEILYKHCFNRLRPDIKKQMVPATTSLTGFSGETTWPLGQLKLLVTIGDATHSTKAWMNFMIVKSLSPYNGIIGRQGLKAIQAVPSTVHGMLKFPTEEWIVTIRSSLLIPAECALVNTSSVTPGEKKAHPTNLTVPLHPNFLDQKVVYFVLADDEDNETIKEEFMDRRLEVNRRSEEWKMQMIVNQKMICEQSAGGSFMNGDMIDFNECVNSLELEDICSFGFRFTWTKSQKNPNSSIMKKLDRIMINVKFLQQFQNAHGMFLPFVISDHSPDVVTIPEGLKKRRSFRFVNYIADKDEFADCVRKEWETKIKGCYMYKVVQKLKRLKK